MARISTGTRTMIATALRSGFTKGILRLFSGSMPSSPNAAETGTLLAEITVDGLPFTPGNNANGLDFDLVTDDPVTMKTYLAKHAAQNWKGIGLANGVIGWGRLYTNAMTTGDSASASRIDGVASAIGDADFTVTTSRVVVGVPVTVSAMKLVINGRK